MTLSADPGEPAAAAPGQPPSDPQVAPVTCAVWRATGKKPLRGRDGLQVLLVRDGDTGGWRWPTQAPRAAVTDEVAPAAISAAVGAVRDQVGLPVVAGVPLLPGAWAATPWTAKARLRPGRGIAEVAWCDIDVARAHLSGARGDAGIAVLEALLGAADAGRLQTRPVLVLRHCHARPRDAWNRADAERPLVSRGRREAAALVDLLQCWRPQRVVSSPWLRCRQSLEPFAGRTGAKVRWKGGLSESGHRRDPGKAAKHLRKLLSGEGSALLCTHRPVLAAVVTALGKACVDDDVRAQLPDADPWLAPAEVLVAHVGGDGRGDGTIVAVERHCTVA